MVLAMIVNLFSIFDPSTSFYMSLNWLGMIVFLFLMPYQFWLSRSRFIHLWYLFINFMYYEFRILVHSSFSNLIFFIRLIILIFFNNFLGLFPYIFTSSSHMRFCFSLSMSIWVGLIMYTVINYFGSFLSHLTPMGTPFVLMPFMVIIESVRLIIRPITLSIRLTANIVAGHLLLSLLGSSGVGAGGVVLLFLLLMVQVMLFVLEIFVSLIQAYVFSVLSALYRRES